MTTIEDAMTKDVVTVDINYSVSHISEILKDNKITSVPVLDGDKLVGIISEADIIKLLEYHSPKINLFLPAPLDLIELPLKLGHEFEEVSKGIRLSAAIPAKDIMTKNVITININSSISHAAELMNKKDVKSLPVLDDNKNLVGILSRKDIISAMF